MTSELRECPFCGGGATVQGVTLPMIADCDDIYVQCGDCAAIGPTVLFDQDNHTADDLPRLNDEAITAWNTRPTDEAEGLLREALRQLADAADELNAAIDLQTYDRKVRMEDWTDDFEFDVSITAKQERDFNNAICAAQKLLARIDAHLSGNAAQGDACCQSCGCINPPWFADNSLWNSVMGGPDATDDPGGILCPTCFIAKAGRTLRVCDPADTGNAALVEELRTLAINVNADVPSEEARLPYVSALHRAAAALSNKGEA